MLAESAPSCQRPRPTPRDWRTDLALAYTDAEHLLRAIDLRPEQIGGLDPSPPGFRLLVPRGFAGLMTPGDPSDPLLLQVLPLQRERREISGFVVDPVGDQAARHGAALLRKYRGRALLVAHGGCAIHCRYCFRRHFDYSGDGSRSERMRAAVETIAGDPGINEVILSGGDPLLLDEAVLANLVERLAALPQLRRLRVHTRIPVVLPSRITTDLCDLLGRTRLKTSVVIHANHPRELGVDCAAAVSRLRACGTILLNQSVLLARVNDDVETLAKLSEELFELGVLPYYLHQLDPVHGAAHFDVDDERALQIHEALRGQLPGYLLPRLVREVPGAVAKRPIVPACTRRSD